MENTSRDELFRQSVNNALETGLQKTTDFIDSIGDRSKVPVEQRVANMRKHMQLGPEVSDDDIRPLVTENRSYVNTAYHVALERNIRPLIAKLQECDTEQEVMDTIRHQVQDIATRILSEEISPSDKTIAHAFLRDFRKALGSEMFEHGFDSLPLAKSITQSEEWLKLTEDSFVLKEAIIKSITNGMASSFTELRFLENSGQVDQGATDAVRTAYHKEIGMTQEQATPFTMALLHSQIAVNQHDIIAKLQRGGASRKDATDLLEQKRMDATATVKQALVQNPDLLYDFDKQLSQLRGLNELFESLGTSATRHRN